MQREREEIIKFLLEELKKVPNREICQVVTAEQMDRIIAELNFEPMLEFLVKDDLEIKSHEIPLELRTEMVLYICILEEENDRYFYDDEIWDFDDAAVEEFVENTKKLLELGKDLELTDVAIADFLEYAKSDKPDI